MHQDPFSPSAMHAYHQVLGAQWNKQIEPGEVFTLSFVVVERHHVENLPPDFSLPPHTWPVVLPDNSHPAEYCEAAKLIAECMLNYGCGS